MLQISEWLPNPKGSDAKGEWVEVQNNGPASINTAGWFLKNEKGTRLSLPPQELGSGEFLLLKRPEFSLTLRNTNGGLGLFDSSGRLVDEAHFLGTAPEGKSFGSPPSEAGESSGNFSWLTPTPGAMNQEVVTLAASVLPIGKPIIESQFTLIPFIVFPILITGIVLYTVKQDEVLSNLLFSRNKDTREDESAAFVLQEETEDRDNFSSKRGAWSWED